MDTVVAVGRGGGGGGGRERITREIWRNWRIRSNKRRAASVIIRHSRDTRSMDKIEEFLEEREQGEARDTWIKQMRFSFYSFFYKGSQNNTLTFLPVFYLFFIRSSTQHFFYM